jgi:tRNA A-37 threonylcarbamoyl transferase component Bud32
LVEKKKLLNDLAGFIRNIHEKGFFHNDLHAGNILIKFNNDYFSPAKDYTLYLMDLHHVKILKQLSTRKRLHNLAQLFNSLSSMLTKSDKLGFVKSYGINALSNMKNERVQHQVDDHPISPPSQGGDKGVVTKADKAELSSRRSLLDFEQLLVEKIESESSRIRNTHYRSRLKRCMKESSNFSRKKINDMKMFFRKGYDTNSFPGLIGKHHNALANNDKDVILKRDFKTALTRFPFKDGGIRSVVVKQYKTTCGLNLIKNIFRNSAGRKSWIAGNGLSVYGFNSARPLALIEKKVMGIVEDSYLIMEDAVHSLEMDRYILKNFHDQPLPGESKKKRTFMRDFAKVIAKMHNRNVFHSDLKTCNIMVKEKDDKSFDFIFLDFDKVAFNEEISIRKRIKNLTQINLSTPGCITITDRFRFLREYLNLCNMADEEKTILREIINISKTEKKLYVSFKGDVTEDW